AREARRVSIVNLGERRFALGDASVRLDRDGDEVVVQNLEYADEPSLQALLDAVAGAANTHRLVGADEGLGRLGFERAGDGCASSGRSRWRSPRSRWRSWRRRSDPRGAPTRPRTWTSGRRTTRRSGTAR